MKLSKEQFKQLILTEVKKIAIEEGWVEAAPVVSEAVSTELPVIKEEVTALEVLTEEPKIEIAEVKRLAEEFTRMKELVDFRRPLLGRDNQ